MDSTTIRDATIRHLRDAWSGKIEFGELEIRPQDLLIGEVFATVIWSVRDAAVFGELGGVRPSQEMSENVVHFDGVTVVRENPTSGDPIFHTVVDWSRVFAQLGVVSHGRRVQGFRTRPPSEWPAPEPAERQGPTS